MTAPMAVMSEPESVTAALVEMLDGEVVLVLVAPVLLVESVGLAGDKVPLPDDPDPDDPVGTADAT